MVVNLNLFELFTLKNERLVDQAGGGGENESVASYLEIQLLSPQSWGKNSSGTRSDKSGALRKEELLSKHGASFHQLTNKLRGCSTMQLN